MVGKGMTTGHAGFARAETGRKNCSQMQAPTPSCPLPHASSTPLTASRTLHALSSPAVARACAGRGPWPMRGTSKGGSMRGKGGVAFEMDSRPGKGRGKSKNS